MNYKVLLFNGEDATQVDKAGNFEFYTKDEAIECCTRWSGIATPYLSYLWDGLTWTLYS